MSNSVLRIKNKYLLGLAGWLNELSLAGQESRERTRFVKLVADHLDQTEKERLELVKKFTEKDENGADKVKKTEDGKEVFDIPSDKLEEFSKEYLGLQEEEFVLDVLEGNKAKIKAVKELVLNTSFKFGPSEGDSQDEKIRKVRQAHEYDAWCEAFEKVDIE